MKHGSQQRFSIRKYSFGAASVLIASLTFLGGQAQADSLTETKTLTEASSVVSHDFHAASQMETNLVIPEFSTEISSVESKDIDSKKNETPPSPVLTETTVENQETSAPSSSKAVENSNTQVNSSQDNSVSGFRTVGRSNIQSDLPSSGTYVFQENANVQNAPKLSSSVLATYEKGQSVNYDSIVSGDNRLWLSYISTTGFRRYVVLPAQNNSGQTTDSAVANTLNALAPQGTYTFSKTAGVKNEARIASPDVATYNPGQFVRYDRVLIADNHRWISYISYSGIRRYVAVEELAQSTKPVTPEVKVEKTGVLSISNVSSTGFDVVVTNVNHPEGVKEVLVPSWSEKNGQDDLIWHKAAKQPNGSYKVRIESSQHKNDSGAYQTHVYYVTNQNRRDYVTEARVIVPQSQVVQKTGQVTISNVSSTGFDVVVKNVNHPEGVKEVLVPSWSEKNGQDDIVWHKAVKQADGSYKARIAIANHKQDTGAYQTHVYYVTNQNRRDYVTETRVIVPRKQVVQKIGQVTTANVSSTGFDVVVKNVNHPEGVKEVLIPSWSEKNGQDDIIWHKAIKQTDGSYKARIAIANHKQDTGAYQSHVYHVTNQNRRDYVTETRVIVPQKQAVQKTGQVVTSNVSSSGFDVEVKNVNHPDGVKEVLVPSWSEKNGQDDLIWHKAVKQTDGSYKARIAIANHKQDTGAYQSHVYYVTNQNNRDYVTETKVTVPETIQISVAKLGRIGFQVRLTGLENKGDVKEVLFPIWTNRNGQDDIIWYTAQFQMDGSYLTLVNYGSHGNETGTYTIHAYYRNTSGQLIGLPATSFTPSIQDRTGLVTISAVDQSNQTFTTKITNVGHPEGVKGVRLAVWSEKNGQDDLKWYDAIKKSDGSYQATTYLMTHDYVNGLYQVHVYYVLSSGKLYGLSASQIMVEVNTPSRYNKTINGKTFTLVGGFNPTTQNLKELVEAIRSLEAQGYNMGFSMIDVTTRKGIEYRADQTYYSASTIKGPFVASLASKNPGSISQSKPTMLAVLTQSSNDGYSQLRSIYGASSIYSWAREAGISESKVQALYPYLTPRDLMGLWTQNYKYFTTSNQGREIATWFEKPNLSPIKSVLGSHYKTFSKAGWIGGWGYHAANDAGIVRTSKGDYILSIMSNADGKLGLLNPAVRVLNEIHKHI